MAKITLAQCIYELESAIQSAAYDLDVAKEDSDIGTIEMLPEMIDLHSSILEYLRNYQETLS